MSHVSETWKEALFYNQNKTHYLEEVSTLRREKEMLTQKNRVLEDKIKVMSAAVV